MRNHKTRKNKNRKFRKHGGMENGTVADVSFIQSVEPLKTKTGKPSTFRKNFVSVEGIHDAEPPIQAEKAETSPIELNVTATTYKEKNKNSKRR